MSEVTIETLQTELNQANNNIKGLVAQLDASKGMLNDSFASCLQLRTNLNLFVQANKEYVENESRLKSEIESLKVGVAGLVIQVNDLTPKTE